MKKLIEKIQKLSADIKSRVMTISGAVGAGVVILAVFGINVSAEQITGVVDLLTVALDNWALLGTAALGLYETFRKEASK